MNEPGSAHSSNDPTPQTPPLVNAKIKHETKLLVSVQGTDHIIAILGILLTVFNQTDRKPEGKMM